MTLFEVEPAPARWAELPSLRGSEKQLPWAGHVRAKALSECDRIIRERQRYVESLVSNGRHEQAARERGRLQAALDHLERIQAQTACAWWIDRRNNTGHQLLTGAAADPGREGFAR